MRMTGLSPLTTGSILALRLILGLLLTPLVGHLAHHSKTRAVRLGGVLALAGWMWLTITFGMTWMLLPAFGLLVAAGNLATTVEIGRWYDLRAPAGIVARETSQVLGRCPMFLLTFPLIFLAPGFYPLLGLLTAILFIGGTRWNKGK
jgi:hypothetical protein